MKRTYVSIDRQNQLSLGPAVRAGCSAIENEQLLAPACCNNGTQQLWGLTWLCISWLAWPSQRRALLCQVWVGVVPVGPKGTALNSSYQNRDSREYKEDLGYAVVNFARMVPDGLLVFFPSYGVLKSCTDFWKNTSVGGTGTEHACSRHRMLMYTLYC